MVALSTQLHFDLGGEPSLTRDDLVASASNAAAVALVDGWPDWHAPCAILVGPQGCGKTHLSEIWRNKSSAFCADQNALMAAVNVAQKGTPVLIDGLLDGGFNEANLFHLINAARSAGTQLLITARSNPERWNIATPDLVSRFKAATSVNIDAPDDALIAAVIVKLFADRQIAFDLAIVDFLVLRVERSLAAVSKVVDAIDRAAMANKSRITKPFVAQVLKSIEISNAEM